MAKRRANGEGSIRKRADGRWEGRYTVGYDPKTGKQQFKNDPISTIKLNKLTTNDLQQFYNRMSESGRVQRKESPLKTKNAYRQIIVPPEVSKILKQKKEREDGFSEYVFSSPTGGPISPDSVLKMLHRVLKRAGLEKVRFHALRHTFVTMALQNGVDVKTLSGLLGHYSAGFTLDTYGHITPAMKQDAAEKVGSFLSAAL